MITTNFFFDEFNTLIRNQSHNSIILQEPVVAYNIPGYYGGVEVKEMIKISSCLFCISEWVSGRLETAKEKKNSHECKLELVGHTNFQPQSQYLVVRRKFKC